MSSKRLLLASAAVIAIVTAPEASRAQVFQDIGTLGGGYSLQPSVSSDGSVVVGASSTAGGDEHAFRWTSTTGMVDLGTLGGQFSEAYGVSSNGSVAVGGANGTSSEDAFLWTGAGGMVSLGTLGGPSSVAFGVNADGSVVVGQSFTAGGLFHAFRWTGTTGMVDLGTLGGAAAQANAVSADGSVVVGYSNPVGSGPYHAFRWTDTTGMADLGTLGGAFSTANAVSSNGAVVVGWSQNGTTDSHGNANFRAFQWTSANGMVDLGTIGTASSAATAVNSNGSVIVGYLQAGNQDTGAFRWTSATGMQSVQDILVAYGVNLSGLQITSANGVSADGTVITGEATYPGAILGDTHVWVANIPVNAFSFLDLKGTDHAIGSLIWGGTVTNSGAQAATLTIGGDNTTTTFIGTIGDGSSTTALTKIGSGTQVLTGTNTYSGQTNVDGGMLEVDGSIASSSLTTVNIGATLTGAGTVGNTLINGGTFAPGTIGAAGTSMTVSGNLAFQSGALYVTQVDASAATFAKVTGTASLAGSVLATFAPGSYVAKQYTILESAGLGHTTFAALDTLGLPPGFSASLSYTPDDVRLNLTAALGAFSPGGLNGNQQDVANALNAFFNGGGTLPPSFLNVFGLTGGNLAHALSQLSGEAATDGEKGAFQIMTTFLGLMLDPSVAGRSGGNGGGALGFAAEREAGFPAEVALAYAAALKAPPSAAVLTFEQRWSVWGAGFGGYNQTSGNAVAGTNTVTARDNGFAAGMDYHYSPSTVLGFALAGGGTNWGLAQGLGNGRSDTFQTGVYGATHWGRAYLGVALGYANHWMSTNRVAPFGDQLTASFNGQSYGARVETGYRYAMFGNPMIGLAPYAAVQAQGFHTPAYTETDVTNGGFGLAFNAMAASDARSELGSRFDDDTTLGDMPLILRGRVAWAHDWATNPALSAAFVALPGANFIVNGATAPKNSALATAGAELYITRNWSLRAKFDGEFAASSQTYAGTGTLRYSW